MLGNWRNWCRLCANECAIFNLESLEELNEIIMRHFHFSLQEMADVCNCICEECYNFVNKLERFKERCSQTSRMLAELCGTNDEELLESDVQDLRFRFLSDSIVVLEDEKFEKGLIKMIPSTSELGYGNATTFDQGVDTSDLIEQELVGLKIEKVSTDCDKSSEEQTVSTIGSEKHNKSAKQEPEEECVDLHENEQDEDHDYQCEEDFEQDSQSGEEIKKKIKTGKKRKTRKKFVSQLAETGKETEGLISCESCDASFRTRSMYVYHLQSKHPDSAELSHGCSICPKRFPSEKKAKLHEYVHLPSDQKMVHPCSYCDKKFSKLVNVQAHIKAVHIGERPYICEECGKAFGTKGALKEHQITHSDEKPFQCIHCPKRFKNLPRLKTHEDIHNDTLYVCPHCGLQLNTKRTLKMHLVVHSDQKKFKCQYCGNEYKRSKALKSHLILHTGLRPYHCPFCEKTFANGSNCRSHKKKAHPKELAALEASGEQSRATNIPKLEQLQPKQLQSSTNADDSVTSATVISQPTATIIGAAPQATFGPEPTEELPLPRNVRLVTAFYQSRSEPPPLNIINPAVKCKPGSVEPSTIVPRQPTHETPTGTISEMITLPPLQLITTNK
ncbi:zinc finger protein weckle-like isoform X2 [Malaya genurostris]|uniref:zinc finger protein weckle-like isoform X2 n=1 Tax=Malaya genurostris TaxID=325434 RepID=UPI0026F3FA3E|nr:zinc finger protein weckle-like isoform X2 [Malaya genurostris]